MRDVATNWPPQVKKDKAVFVARYKVSENHRRNRIREPGSKIHFDQKLHFTVHFSEEF
jgi:hypothetical protein